MLCISIASFYYIFSNVGTKSLKHTYFGFPECLYFRLITLFLFSEYYIFLFYKKYIFHFSKYHIFLFHKNIFFISLNIIYSYFIKVSFYCSLNIISPVSGFIPSTIANDSNLIPLFLIISPPCWNPFSIAIPIPSTVAPASSTS